MPAIAVVDEDIDDQTPEFPLERDQRAQAERQGPAVIPEVAVEGSTLQIIVDPMSVEVASYPTGAMVLLGTHRPGGYGSPPVNDAE